MVGEGNGMNFWVPFLSLLAAIAAAFASWKSAAAAKSQAEKDALWAAEQLENRDQVKLELKRLHECNLTEDDLRHHRLGRVARTIIQLANGNFVYTSHIDRIDFGSVTLLAFYKTEFNFDFWPRNLTVFTIRYSEITLITTRWIDPENDKDPERVSCDDASLV